MKVGMSAVSFKSRAQNVKNLKNNNQSVAKNVAFTGSNAKQVMHIVPEGVVTKGGGVGTVINDWVKKLSNFDPTMEHNFFIPYYNADVFDDAKGNLQVKPIKGADGNFYFVDSVTDIDAVDKAGKPKAVTKHKLTPVADDTIDFFDKSKGQVVKKEVGLFQIDNSEFGLPENIKVYTTLSEGTGTMPKVYGYSYKDGSMYFHYSENAKASIKLAEKLREQTNGGFDPQNVMIHDYHGSAAFKYMQDEALAGNPLFQQIRSGYVIHNGGRGYQGLGASPFEMFTALAKPEQIEKVMKSDEYAKAASSYQFDGGKEMANLVKKIMPDLVDERGELNPSLVPLKLATEDKIHNISSGLKEVVTVSPGYHDELLNYPEMSEGITSALQSVQAQGKFMGIFNGLTPPDAKNQVFSTLYKSNPVLKTANGETKLVLKYADGSIVQPLKTFDPGSVTADNIGEVIKTQKENAKNLVERIVKHKDAIKPDAVSSWNPTSLVTGNIEKGAKITSNLNGDTIKMIQEPDAKLFTSWGRGDFQKGIDELLLGIKKYAAKNPEDKKSVFVVCGSLGSDAESSKIKNLVNDLASDKNLQGRFAYIDGWGAADALALSSDSSIFTSRYEPCGLTPQEAHARGAKTIVTKTGGMATSTREGVDGFLTNSSFNEISEAQINESEYATGFKKEIAKIEDSVKTAFEKKNLVRKRNGLSTLSMTDDELKVSVAASPDYTKAMRRCRDEIISDDIADTIKRAVNVDPKKSAQMTLEAINAKVDWTNNSAINDGVRSAFESYKEFCYEGAIPDLAGARKLIDDDVINSLTFVEKAVQTTKTVAKEGVQTVSEVADSAKSAVKDSVENTLKTTAKTSNNKKIAFAASIGVAVLAAAAATGVYLKTKKANSKVAAPNANKTQVATSSSTSAKQTVTPATTQTTKAAVPQVASNPVKPVTQAVPAPANTQSTSIFNKMLMA